MLRSELIQSVSGLLTAQAKDIGDAVALRDGHGSVSYRELADRSARLAGHLREAGVQPGDSVGVYMANSTVWAVAMLATVRAGAVSVPIPAKVTPQQAAFMLAAAGAPLAFLAPDRRAPALGPGHAVG